MMSFTVHTRLGPACRTGLLLLAAALVGCQSMQTLTGMRERVALSEPLWEYAATLPGAGNPSTLPQADRNAEGARLSISGLEFDEGVGLHGPSVLVLAPGGRASRLRMLAGIDDATVDTSSDARLTISADNGRVLANERLRAGDDPTHIDIALDGVERVRIAVAAPEGVYTDLVLAHIEGVPGVRDALRRSRHAFQDELHTEASAPSLPARLPHGPVIFRHRHPLHGSCIGMSNNVAVAVFTETGGALIDLRPLGCQPGPLERHATGLEPQARRIDSAPAIGRSTWRWRVDPDGGVRLLSPPDPVHNVRWSRRLYLVPDEPVLYSAVMLKNTGGPDSAWSIGTYFECVPGTQLEVHGDGRSFSARAGESELHVAHLAPRSGYFPYKNRALVAETDAGTPRVTATGEIVLMDRGAHTTCEQYLAVIPASESDGLAAATRAIGKARDHMRSSPAPGVPTGRTRNVP